MLEAVKVALDPSPAAERLLLSNAGAARFAYNAGLAHFKESLEAWTAARDAGVPETERPKVPWSNIEFGYWWRSVRDEIAPWWRENSKHAYESGLEALARAIGSWSDSRRGKRRGRKVGFPRFKKRAKASPSFRYRYSAPDRCRIDEYGVKLPRIGRVHTHERLDTRIAGRYIRRVSISRSGGRWFAAFTVEAASKDRRVRRVHEIIGVDVGLKNLAVLSTGEVVPNPSPLKAALRKLRKAGRAQARKQADSVGRKRANERLHKIHAQVANIRLDGLHKLTTRLARTYQTIVVEDLNVAGMTKNRRLARSISDAGFGELRRQLGYKTEKCGGSTLVIADRWMPSTKTCSNCGATKDKMPLSLRIYACEHCGLVMDRDLNAALNLAHLVAGRRPETQNGGGAEQKTRPVGQLAVKPQPRPRKGQNVDVLLATATA